jgi:hypothetical protein
MFYVFSLIVVAEEELRRKRWLHVPPSFLAMPLRAWSIGNTRKAIWPSSPLSFPCSRTAFIRNPFSLCSSPIIDHDAVLFVCNEHRTSVNSLFLSLCIADRIFSEVWIPEKWPPLQRWSSQRPPSGPPHSRPARKDAWKRALTQLLV